MWKVGFNVGFERSLNQAKVVHANIGKPLKLVVYLCLAKEVIPKGCVDERGAAMFLSAKRKFLKISALYCE